MSQDFTEQDVRKALARLSEKLSRQQDAVKITQAEIQLWQSVLEKDRPTK